LDVCRISGKRPQNLGLTKNDSPAGAGTRLSRISQILKQPAPASHQPKIHNTISGILTLGCLSHVANRQREERQRSRRAKAGAQ
jgi:hypothetical protein